MPGGKCEANGFCSFADSTCGPEGQRYSDGPTAGMCVMTTIPIDAPVQMIDAPVQMIDSMTSGTEMPLPTTFCLGKLVHLCVPTTPTGTVPLPSNLDTVTSTLCRTDVTDMAGNPVNSYCVITGGTIAGSTTATGTRPLVLMSSGDIAIATLDVASHRGMPDGAAANSSMCKPPGASQTGGGGGGGGFGGAGGDGGNGAGNGGKGGMTSAAASLRGGCPGADGTTTNTHGNGGGAVMLMAATSISISDAIDASGAGALAASATNGAGASGGGSGGLIDLEAPTINNAGVVYANGGSGSEGSGSGGTQGQAGNDPTGVSAAPGGGGLSGTGGNGGNGGSRAVGNGDGLPGDNATATGIMKGGGGGGGGGVGVILTFGGTLTGNVSPAPTVVN